MTAPFWPDAPLPVQPHQVQPRETTFHRLHGVRNGRQEMWIAAVSTVEQFTAALTAAGWQVKTETFVGPRWCTEGGEMWDLEEA